MSPMVFLTHFLLLTHLSKLLTFSLPLGVRSSYTSFPLFYFFLFFFNLNSGIASVPQASSGMTEVFLSQHVIKQLKL